MGQILASGDAIFIDGGSSDPKIRLWDVATGTKTATFDLDTDWILSISFSPEMTPIALGGFGWYSRVVGCGNGHQDCQTFRDATDLLRGIFTR